MMTIFFIYQSIIFDSFLLFSSHCETDRIIKQSTNIVTIILAAEMKRFISGKILSASLPEALFSSVNGKYTMNGRNMSANILKKLRKPI